MGEKLEVRASLRVRLLEGILLINNSAREQYDNALEGLKVGIGQLLEERDEIGLPLFIRLRRVHQVWNCKLWGDFRELKERLLMRRYESYMFLLCRAFLELETVEGSATDREIRDGVRYWLGERLPDNGIQGMGWNEMDMAAEVRGKRGEEGKRGRE